MSSNSQEEEMSEPLQAKPTTRAPLQGSLLERIQRQREREASVASSSAASSAATNSENLGNSVELQTAPMQQQQPPNYSPVDTSHDAATMGAAEQDNSSSWLGSRFQVADGSTESLLGASEGEQQGYTMMGYFQTFVQDVYGGFRSLPIWAQAILVLVLLIIAIKLL